MSECASARVCERAFLPPWCPSEAAKYTHGVSVTRPPPSTPPPPRRASHHQHEVRMLAQLHFPSIVRLFGVALDGPIAYVVTEWVPLTLMQARRREDFTVPSFVNVITQLLDGIAYIHDRQVRPIGSARAQRHSAHMPLTLSANG